MKDPIVVNNLLNDKDFSDLLLSLRNPKSFGFDPGFSRYCIADNGLQFWGN
jgi:hypothetical protein